MWDHAMCYDVGLLLITMENWSNLCKSKPSIKISWFFHGKDNPCQLGRESPLHSDSSHIQQVGSICPYLSRDNTAPAAEVFPSSSLLDCEPLCTRELHSLCSVWELCAEKWKIIIISTFSFYLLLLPAAAAASGSGFKHILHVETCNLKCSVTCQESLRI